MGQTQSKHQAQNYIHNAKITVINTVLYCIYKFYTAQWLYEYNNKHIESREIRKDEPSAYYWGFIL